MTNNTVAIFGLGYMGTAHLSKLIELGVPRENIIGVETDIKRHQAIEEKYGIRVVSSKDEVPAGTNVAIIATPSDAHLDSLRTCRDLGIKNVLCEKPFVLSSEELDTVESLGLTIYVGYLINFSPALDHLRKFMAEHSVVVSQVHTVWGNNWLPKRRWIGPNLEEELTHPLVAALNLIGFGDIQGVTSKVLGTFVPHMVPELAHSGSRDNDTSLGRFLVGLSDRTVPVAIFSSFNFFTQRRWMDVALAGAGEQLPRYRACIEFDTGGKRYDHLAIVDASTGDPVAGYENLPFSEDKLFLQMEAVLKAFSGEQPDPRLVSSDQAAMVVRFLDGCLG